MTYWKSVIRATTRSFQCANQSWKTVWWTSSFWLVASDFEYKTLALDFWLFKWNFCHLKSNGLHLTALDFQLFPTQKWTQIATKKLICDSPHTKINRSTDHNSWKLKQYWFNSAHLINFVWKKNMKIFVHKLTIQAKWNESILIRNSGKMNLIHITSSTYESQFTNYT